MAQENLKEVAENQRISAQMFNALIRKIQSFATLSAEAPLEITESAGGKIISFHGSLEAVYIEITAVVDDSGKSKYEWKQIEKTGIGYGEWSDVADGWTGPDDDLQWGYAYDLAEETGSTSLNVGDRVRAYIVYPLDTDASRELWFSTGGGGGTTAVMVKLIGTYAGAGMYAGKVCPAIVTDIDPTTDVSQSNFGGGGTGPDVIVMNSGELASATGTHWLDTTRDNRIFPCILLYTNSDGTQVYGTFAAQTPNCA